MSKDKLLELVEKQIEANLKEKNEVSFDNRCLECKSFLNEYKSLCDKKGRGNKVFLNDDRLVIYLVKCIILISNYFDSSMKVTSNDSMIANYIAFSLNRLVVCVECNVPILKRLEEIFKQLVKYDDVDSLLCYLEEGDESVRKDFKKNLINSQLSEKNLDFLCKLSDYLSANDGSFIEIMNFFIEDSEKFLLAFNLLIDACYNKMMELDSSANSNCVLDVNRDNKLHLDTRSCKTCDTLISMVNAFVSRYEKQHRAKLVSYDKKSFELERIKKLIEAEFDKDEITCADAIMSIEFFDDLRVELLRYIFEHNKSYYESLEKRRDSLSENTEAKYRMVLKDHKISSKGFNIASIMHNTVDEVNEILDVLTVYHVDGDFCKKILQVTNVDVFREIRQLLQKGILWFHYAFSHIELFMIDSNVREILNNNVELLNKFGINPLDFSNKNNRLLFLDNELFRNNIEILHDYDLVRGLKNCDCYDFVGFTDLESRISKLIEYGYEDYLVNCLGVLNSNSLNRLDIIHALNIPVDEEDFEDVVDSKRFFVPDDRINEYLLNVLPYKEKINLRVDLSVLEQYIDGKCYIFNGVRISVIKVKRALRRGYSLYDAIFSDMIVSEEDYNNIISVLIPKNKENVVG